MKKFLGFILCAFIPSKRIRWRIREIFYSIPSKTVNRGKNNRIFIVSDNGKRKRVFHVPGCKIYFRGNDNTVIIYKPYKLMELTAKLYGNSTIVIKSSQYLKRRLKVGGMRNSKLYIGSDFSTNSLCEMELTNHSDIIIGDDCMFSRDIKFRNGDGHAMFDITTGKCTNWNSSIFIGNHVWLGRSVMILKGAVVPDNCVVGANSLVTKKFSEHNVVIGGVPAKILKRGIMWSQNPPE